MSVALKLDEMSLAEKLQAMEDLWNDLCHRVEDIAMPEWHGEELSVREKDLQAGKDRFSDWESVKSEIRESVK